MLEKGRPRRRKTHERNGGGNGAMRSEEGNDRQSTRRAKTSRWCAAFALGLAAASTLACAGRSDGGGGGAAGSGGFPSCDTKVQLEVTGWQACATTCDIKYAFGTLASQCGESDSQSGIPNCAVTLAKPEMVGLVSPSMEAAAGSLPLVYEFTCGGVAWETTFDPPQPLTVGAAPVTVTVTVSAP